MIEKDLLHKYFRAETSQDENERILDWLDESDENRKTFLTERKLWNMITLSGKVETNENAVNSLRKKSLIKYCVAAAAACVLIVVGIRFFIPSDNGTEQHILVPVGQRAQVILADGTSVWLNSNTSLEYNSRFNKKERTVKLKGEAYFDVSRDEKHPFVIETEDHRIEVLGTEFNVRAYDSVTDFETAVLEGTVRVTS